jgi:hypothetical protein
MLGLRPQFMHEKHGVTWYLWVSLAAAMSLGILLGFAGIQATRGKRRYGDPG